jgi:putative DNA primase/helicase
VSETKSNQAQYNTEDAGAQEDEQANALKRNDPCATADRFLETLKAPLIRYRGGFYEWTNSHYSGSGDEEIRAAVYGFLRKAVVRVVEIDHDGSSITSLQPFCPDDRSVHKVIDALRSRVLVPSKLQAPAWLPEATPDERAHNPADILPCNNGLLDLSTEELFPHTPAFLTMNAVGYAYDREATAPRWQQFQDEVIPDDPESRSALKRLFGYLLTPDTSQQKIFALIGEKRSGKGTIAYVLKELIGSDNVTNPTLSGLMDQFGLAGLIDKRLAVIGDARLSGETHKLVERLLSISGQDGISIPRKYKDDWNGTLDTRFLVLSNKLPSFTDASGVIADRFILIRFLESFFGREDTKLKGKLKAELPGILNWAIEGFRELRERGCFDQPARSLELVEMLADVASPIGKFIRECCEVGAGFSDSRDAVHEAYKVWCEANDHRPMSKTKFDLELNAARPGVIPRKVGARGSQTWKYFGIRRFIPEGTGRTVVDLVDRARVYAHG